MTSFLLLFPLLIIPHLGPSSEQNSIYIEAEPLVRKPPVYPRSEARSQNAGMVEVEMMISKDGSIFDPVVIRSSNKKFERSALDAVLKYQYKPALRDGSPVDSRSSIRIRYKMTNQLDAVSRRFATLYKNITAELDKTQPNQAKLESLILKMKKSEFVSTYTLARYNLVLLRHAMLFGDELSQIEATKALLVFDDGVSEENQMFDDKLRFQIQSSLFGALIKTQRFAEALDVYSEFLETTSEAGKFDEIVSSVRTMQDSEQAVTVSIVLNDSGSTLEHLFKRTIALYEIEGDITNLKLRCDSRYANIPFKFDAEYQIPKAWGKCKVQVVGEPQSKAKLVQY